MRIDKWLWAARFYKTRSLAVHEIERHRVQINDEAVKPAREVKVGDVVLLRRGPVERTVRVLGLSSLRGSAPVAQQLYQETPESLSAQAQARESRRLTPEPAQSIEHGRPTKRDRRQIDQVRQDWGPRWSASIDDAPES